MCPIKIEHRQSDKGVLGHLLVVSRGFPIGVSVTEDWIHDPDLPWELVGSGKIATGSVRKSAAF